MTFAWPAGLLLLLLVPLGIALDRWVARRRARALVGFAHPAGAAATAAATPRDRARTWRRRLPSLITVAGFVTLVVGLARPQVALSAPRLEGTVILAFDVSASMAATDYAPTRMEAAKAAATAFVQRQPASVQVGIVAFSDAGVAVQQATSDQAQVLDAIARLQPQRGTSLGGGILAAVRAVDSAEHPNEGFYTNRSPGPSQPAVPAGSHTAAIVVLLSDGENNESPDVTAAAQAAADRGIRVDTVGIGSVAGTTLDLDGFQVHTALDEATLRSIADTTRGTYIGAPDANQLNAAYDAVDASLVVTAARPTEVTALFALLGLAALATGLLSSLAWLGRAP
jgi:Ca-activated chloride channel family protein